MGRLKLPRGTSCPVYLPDWYHVVIDLLRLVWYLIGWISYGEADLSFRGSMGIGPIIPVAFPSVFGSYRQHSPSQRRDVMNVWTSSLQLGQALCG